LSFIPCLRSANEANPSEKQNPGDNLKKFFRYEFALAVAGIRPMTNEITIRIRPEKKWTIRITFCDYNKVIYPSVKII
jgi:hypothetical protein